MNGPLRLAIVVNLYPPYIIGGNEVLAHDVVVALRERGHTVHVITGRGRLLPDDGLTHQALHLDLDRKEDVFLGGLSPTFRRLVAWHLYEPRTARKVAAALAGIRPDLVIAWNLFGASLAPIAAARAAGCPVLAQPADRWLVNGLYDFGAVAPGRISSAARVLAWVGQVWLRRQATPDRVFAVSEFVRGLHTRRGFPERRSRATYLGVPTRRFPESRRSHPRRGPWRLVFAGQLWEGKGPDVAVAALREIRSRASAPAASLDIFGTGTADYLAHLRDVIASSGQTDHIALRGKVSREQLALEFREGDVFLFCSTWDEPFSSGLLEAMSTGLPCVASRTGGTPEAIIDGDNGLLVPPRDPGALADAIFALQNDEQLFLRVSRNAARDVRARWSFDGYIDRLEAGYREVIEEASGSG